MNKMLGKRLRIAGMVIEVISDEGDRWMTRNVTTKEKVAFQKTVLENAIKLGKAEEVSGIDGRE